MAKPEKTSKANSSVTRTFLREKETKNTIRFTEDTEEAPVVGTLYLQKHFAKKAEKVNVTITLA